MKTEATSQNDSEIEINTELLHAVIRMNTLLLAVVFGLVCGLSLFFVTYASLLRGLPHPGSYLNLIGIFLPGYEVSHTGAWIGMFWGALVGGCLAAIFYRVYARGIPGLVNDYMKSGAVNDDLLSAKLELGGHSLGLALGTVLAVGLAVTTNWLVIRGTADESMHAQLLVNYLPGYSVSTVGSVIGAVELFVFAYLLSRLFSAIYNYVADFRSRDKS